MSEYAPAEDDIIRGMRETRDGLFREVTEVEVARGITAIKADAWDECAESAGDMASALKSQNPHRIEGGEER